MTTVIDGTRMPTMLSKKEAARMIHDKIEHAVQDALIKGVITRDAVKTGQEEKTEEGT
jgi:hypothetical protein